MDFISNLHLNDRKLRDAFRVSLQSTVAVALTFILLRQFNLDELFVGLLSAVLVVEPSIGGTLQASIHRVIATLVGSAVGFICMSVLPWGIGTIVAVTISVMIISFIATLKPNWQYGIVGCIAIALGAESNAMEVSIARVTSIGIGASTGILVSLVIWPDKSSRRAKRYIDEALKCIAQWLESNTEIATTDKEADKDKLDNGSCHFHIEKAKQASDSVQFADAKELRTCIDCVESFFNSVIILNRVALKGEDQKKAIEQNESSTDQAGDIVAEIKDIVKALTEGDKSGDSEDVRKLLEKLKQSVDDIKSSTNETLDSEESDDGRLNASVLAFAYDEIQDSIEKLVEHYGKL